MCMWLLQSLIKHLLEQITISMDMIQSQFIFDFTELLVLYHS